MTLPHLLVYSTEQIYLYTSRWWGIKPCLLEYHGWFSTAQCRYCLMCDISCSHSAKSQCFTPAPFEFTDDQCLHCINEGLWFYGTIWTFNGSTLKAGSHIYGVLSECVSRVFISLLWISSTSCPHHFLLAVLLIYHFKHLNLELLLLHSTHWKFLKLLVVSACTVNDSESWPSYALPQLLNLFYPNFPLC